MNRNDPEWYKKLVYDGKEIKAEIEAEKMRRKIEIGKRLIQDKENIDDKVLRKISRNMKNQLMELDVKIKDMPSQLRSWMILAENLGVE